MSTMTRQNFQLIANSVRRTYQVTSFTEKNAVKKRAKYEAIRLVANDLAGSLATTNPQFDQDRFLAACGIGSITTDHDGRINGGDLSPLLEN